MAKRVLTSALLVAALALPLPGATLAQDDPPQSLQALGLQFVVQAEQIDQLHERIDDVRIGVLRERIKALETAATELAGAFAAAPFAVLAAPEIDE